MVEVVGDGRGKWRTLRPRFIGHAHKLGDIVRGPTGNASDGSDLTTGRETPAESVRQHEDSQPCDSMSIWGSEHCVCRLVPGWPAADRRAAYSLVELVPFSRKLRSWSADSADANGYDRTVQVRRLIRRGSGGAAVNAVGTAEPVVLERVGVIARRPTCR